MTVDFGLNLIWLTLAACALLATRFANRRSAFAQMRAVRFVSVIVVFVALFPYISALDDSLQLAQLGVESPSSVKTCARLDSHTSDLVWVFESLNDAELAAPSLASPPLASYPAYLTQSSREIRRPTVPPQGRGPPFV